VGIVARTAGADDHRSMSTSSPTPPDEAGAPKPADEPTAPEEDGKRHRGWLWVSIALAVVVAGLLVWGLRTQSDLDKAQSDNTVLQTAGSGIQHAYDDLRTQPGLTSADLAATEQDVQQAESDATAAEQQAGDAEQKAAKAETQSDKASAETEQAQADAKSSDAKSKVAVDCAKAYVSAFGQLFEGTTPSDQAAKVGQQLDAVTADCKAAFAG
jgi:hypothetical protein